MDPNNQTSNQNGAPAPASTPTPTPVTAQQPISTSNPAPQVAPTPQPTPAPTTQPVVPQFTPAAEPTIPQPQQITQQPSPITQPTETQPEDTAQTEENQQTVQPQKKSSTKILIIVLLVLLIIGGTFAALILTGIIPLGGGSGSGGGSGGNTSELSVPTIAKIRQLCEANNGEYTETVGEIEMALRDALESTNSTINDHYCSNGIIVTMSDTDYLDLLSEINKKHPETETEYPVKASTMAKMYSLLYSKSYKKEDGTIENNNYTFTPIIDETEYYKANMGLNGENDKGIFIVYKNVIVVATNDISEEYLDELGINK